MDSILSLYTCKDISALIIEYTKLIIIAPSKMTKMLDNHSTSLCPTINRSITRAIYDIYHIDLRVLWISRTEPSSFLIMWLKRLYNTIKCYNDRILYIKD